MRLRTAGRVVLAILVTALIPLVVVVIMGRMAIAGISATAFNPEFGQHLDQALGVYADLVKNIKARWRVEAEAMARAPRLRRAVAEKDALAILAELRAEVAAHADVVSARVVDQAGAELASHGRGRPVDAAKEKSFTVRQGLGDAEPEDPQPALEVVFATDSGPFDELASAQEFAQTYHQIERKHRSEYIDDVYGTALLVLVAATIALGFAAGVLVVRPVTRRIGRLARTARQVGEGDLAVRVGDPGTDEVADLGRAFDRMLDEISASRERIEFLRRMSEWQKMARRLAHEIKNPLTPIQLAVEECHRRYEGEDAAYKRIVQTTYEVVEEEVGTLRRLVGEFSSFARLPRADLVVGDLHAFLRDQGEHLGAPRDDESAALAHGDVTFDVPEGTMPVAMDTEMLHRVVTNLVRNAAEALRDAKRRGKVVVTARAAGGEVILDVDDDGPGIPAEQRAGVFDPYVTTKHDGTGLGLTIVKKIVVDHGGRIDAAKSPLGGARFEIRLPKAGTPASDEAIARARAEREDAPASPR